MRMLRTGLTIASIVLALPMVVMIAPRLVFRLYTSNLPIPPDHPHVRASLQSIQAIGLEALCLLPMAALVPSLCIDSVQVHASLPVLCRVGLEQHVLYEALVHNAPTLLTIDLVSSMGHAAEALLVLGDFVLCDGEVGVKGEVDTTTLLSVSSAAGNISTALRDVLAHIELSIARMLFIQDGIHFGLSILDYADAGGWPMQRGTTNLDRLLAISIDATTDSMRHIVTVLQSAALLSSTLLETLREMHSHDDCVGGRCTGPAVAPLCSEATPLFLEDSEDILTYTIARLAALHAVLDGVSDLTSSTTRSPTAIYSIFTSISAADLVVGSHRSLLEAQLRAIQEARILAGSEFKEWRLGDLFKSLTSPF